MEDRGVITCSEPRTHSFFFLGIYLCIFSLVPKIGSDQLTKIYQWVTVVVLLGTKRSHANSWRNKLDSDEIPIWSRQVQGCLNERVVCTHTRNCHVPIGKFRSLIQILLTVSIYKYIYIPSWCYLDWYIKCTVRHDRMRFRMYRKSIRHVIILNKNWSKVSKLSWKEKYWPFSHSNDNTVLLTFEQLQWSMIDKPTFSAFKLARRSQI